MTDPAVYGTLRKSIAQIMVVGVEKLFERS